MLVYTTVATLITITIMTITIIIMLMIMVMNGPCAPKEKWHRKEHNIIIIIIIMVVNLFTVVFAWTGMYISKDRL